MLSIANNYESICIVAAGPNTEGKYSGWITFGPERNYRAIISTAYIFLSVKDATMHMAKVARFCKKWAHKDIESPECVKEFESLNLPPAE